MYELIQISENDYYIDCPAKMGLVKINSKEVMLIDSGSDKDAGKKVIKILEANGWKLKAIFNTHSHADHIGGNKLLQERTGCEIYAKGLDAVYTNNPILEPIGLYGGLPYKELKHKFLLAQESCANQYGAEGPSKDVLNGMQIINLAGHSFDMTGFITPDNNAFIADSVSSKETLEKYTIGYMWNPKEALSALEYLKTVKANKFVPSHADVCEDITELAEINIQSINNTAQAILKICEKPETFEAILKNIFDEYNMTMNAQQYVLIGSTVRSYLSWLYEEEKLLFEFTDNEMVWKLK